MMIKKSTANKYNSRYTCTVIRIIYLCIYYRFLFEYFNYYYIKTDINLEYRYLQEGNIIIFKFTDFDGKELWFSWVISTIK